MTITEPARAATDVRDVLDRVLRAVLLLVLLVAGVGMLAVAQPTYREPGDFLADLRAGRVDVITYDWQTSQLAWGDGWRHWFRTRVPESVADPVDVETADAVDAVDPVPGDTIDLRVVRDALERLDGPAVQEFDGDTVFWVHRIPWDPLRLAAVPAWWLAAGLMLLRPSRRVAGRWAWTWLFTFGQAGALLYLLVEPRPLWRRPGSPLPARVPMNGAAGCLGSLLMRFAVTLAGSFLLWLLG